MPNDQSESGRDKAAPGETTPHGTGERVADESVPRERKAEPGSGPRRDPLPDEHKTERPGDDVPGLRKKIT